MNIITGIALFIGGCITGVVTSIFLLTIAMKKATREINNLSEPGDTNFRVERLL